MFAFKPRHPKMQNCVYANAAVLENAQLYFGIKMFFLEQRPVVLEFLVST